MSRAQWRRRRGECPICHVRQWLVGHHLVYRQHVEAEGGDVWDIRNALFLGQDCRCHAEHHNGQYRIPVAMVHRRAREFANELFGSKARATAYFERYYAERRPERRLPKRRSQSDQALSAQEARAYVRRRERARGR